MLELHEFCCQLPETLKRHKTKTDKLSAQQSKPAAKNYIRFTTNWQSRPAVNYGLTKQTAESNHLGNKMKQKIRA